MPYPDREQKNLNGKLPIENSKSPSHFLALDREDHDERNGIKGRGDAPHCPPWTFPRRPNKIRTNGKTKVVAAKEHLPAGKLPSLEGLQYTARYFRQ